MVINTYGWTRFTAHLLFLRKCVSLHLQVSFPLLPPGDKLWSWKAWRFHLHFTQCLLQLLRSSSYWISHSLVPFTCHKAMHDSQAVLSQYAGCRTAPIGYRNVTVDTDVWLASMIWFWVVFYAPAITSVASLVPRPPFNNARGLGMRLHVGLYLLLQELISQEDAKREEEAKREGYRNACAFSSFCNLNHPHTPTSTHTHLKHSSIQFYIWQTPTHKHFRVCGLFRISRPTLYILCHFYFRLATIKLWYQIHKV